MRTAPNLPPRTGSSPTGTVGPGAWPAARTVVPAERTVAGDHRVGRRPQRGASVVEYCLLVALVALVALGALASFGGARDGVLHHSSSRIGSL